MEYILGLWLSGTQTAITYVPHRFSSREECVQAYNASRMIPTPEGARHFRVLEVPIGEFTVRGTCIPVPRQSR